MRLSQSMIILKRNITTTNKKRVDPNRLKMVKYLTDDEAEQSHEEEESEATIENSIMNLLTLSTSQNTGEDNPIEESILFNPIEESILLDTDGPKGFSDDRTLYSGVVTMSILLSTTVVVVMYLCSMDTLTYPVWT
jgi:ribosomal protein L33